MSDHPTTQHGNGRDEPTGDGAEARPPELQEAMEAVMKGEHVGHQEQLEDFPLPKPEEVTRRIEEPGSFGALPGDKPAHDLTTHEPN
ncbi:MAG: hypothetical protein ACRDY2_13595 [Acidimicrobiales bacterium]